MKKDVLITIKGMQGDLIDQDEIEMVTTGSLYKKKDTTFITYVDTSLDTETETKTTVKVNENQVALTRFGATNTHLIFETGKEHFTPYETPFGIFEILSETKSIDVKEEETSFYLSVKYHLQVNHVSIGTTFFELTAKDI